MTNTQTFKKIKNNGIHCVAVESGLGQKYALSKNPQFLSDHYEILTKEGTHEDLILTKFRIISVKKLK